MSEDTLSHSRKLSLSFLTTAAAATSMKNGFCSCKHLDRRRVTKIINLLKAYYSPLIKVTSTVRPRQK